MHVTTTVITKVPGEVPLGSRWKLALQLPSKLANISSDFTSQIKTCISLC